MLSPIATIHHLGYIPTFLNSSDKRSAAKQFDANYIGRWRPLKGFEMNPETFSIKYPGDPKLLPIAVATLRQERIFIYESAWVAIVQPDGTFEFSRMD
jgi:hypothetical protein